MMGAKFANSMVADGLAPASTRLRRSAPEISSRVSGRPLRSTEVRSAPEIGRQSTS